MVYILIKWTDEPALISMLIQGT